MSAIWTCDIHGPTTGDCAGCDVELIALTEETYLAELAEAMDVADESDEARWAEIDSMDVEGDA